MLKFYTFAGDVDYVPKRCRGNETKAITRKWNIAIIANINVEMGMLCRRREVWQYAFPIQMKMTHIMEFAWCLK